MDRTPPQVTEISTPEKRQFNWYRRTAEIDRGHSKNDSADPGECQFKPCAWSRGMAEKRTKAEKWRRNVERLERREDARREIVDIREKRQELAALLEEQIRQRAHQFYEARGRQSGHEVEDWLNAEAEIRAARRKAPAASGRVIPFPLSST
jgi:hypothetical protein